MRTSMMLGLLCVLGGAAACGDKADEPGSSASSGAEEAVKDTGDKVEEAAEDTGDKVEEATE
ncbi:MAG: YtxH domain-containing protein [Polyangiales bacterium]